jgi:hypothetical protein
MVLAAARLRGTTVSLQLPDGQVVVVNCESKLAEHFAGHQGNRRELPHAAGG